ncbi:PACE efflux transporter [Marinagarivorans algicola]|uniref:PACE efflux transporter n=2 Tax=Marinagarivorans algicola TaxID=1513270 RepID=UPI0006B993AA|nr:PACE efflux transporter [Marinagarivorans algicola]
MTTIERIYQAIFFEIIALIIVVPTTVMVAGYAATDMLVVGAGLSFFAVLWNYIYNILFDKVAGLNRVKRHWGVRSIHAVGFELGMIVITLPALAWYLAITWREAIFLELGFLVFILIYTFIFNWLYDTYQPYKKWCCKN